MRITKCMLKIFIIQIILFIFSLHGYALEKSTHFEINKYIAENNIEGFSLDQYLEEQLGFHEGIDKILEQFEGQKIDGKPPKIFNWLGYGGKKEDEPIYLRSFRHFHNPLETWDEAGLWGRFESSVIWAQRTNQFPGGHYSWQDVRGYFYQALTSQDQTTRENYFAETFRGVGQLMHLVEDASVPLHTRNDAHVRFNYEKWVERFRNNKYKSGDDFIFNTWLSNESRYGYDKSVLSITPNPLAPIAIARIIDTDKYTGNNPAVTKSEPIGIAEYSNANFLSNGTIPGTIFDGDFLYPFIPDLPSSEYDIVDPRDTSGIIIRSYFETGFDNDVDGRYRLATVPIYVIVFDEELCEEDKRLLPTSLDKNVYQDYAERLIPRAVGYSAGLLDYFFRGTLEISAPDNYAYTIIDGSITPHEFIYIKAKVRNTTPDEVVGEGIIQAVARYKKRTDYQPDLSTDPPTDVQMDKPFSYSVSAPIEITSLNSTESTEYIFDFTQGRIPAGITDLYLHVIFKGTLGNETDNAIAVGMKDLNEPEHLVFWNNTDYFLLDGVPRKAEDIENDPNVGDYGYIYPYPFTEEIGFSNTDPDESTPIVATIQDLPPARYSRLIILVDNPEQFWVKDHLTSFIDDATWNYTFTSAINQEAADGSWNNTPVYNVRGIIHHQMTYFIRHYPYYVFVPDAFPAPSENSSGPYPVTTINFP